MNLKEAIESSNNGNFVSNEIFSEDQSMHTYNDRLYYEDGANLTDNNFVSTLEHYDWAKQGWYVKFSKEKVDKAKLKKMHEESMGHMLDSNVTYETCII